MIQANVAWGFGHRPTLGRDTSAGSAEKQLGHPGIEPGGPGVSLHSRWLRETANGGTA